MVGLGERRQSCVLRQTLASKTLGHLSEEEGCGSAGASGGWEAAQCPGLRAFGGATSEEPSPQSRSGLCTTLMPFSHIWCVEMSLLKVQAHTNSFWLQWAWSKVGSYSISWINSQWQLQSRLARLHCIALPLVLHSLWLTPEHYIQGKKSSANTLWDLYQCCEMYKY